MVLSLNYTNLSDTIAQANKLSNEISQYCDELTRKVQKKLYDVDGGMTSALDNADYYIKSKLKKLRDKAASAKTVASKTNDLLSTARRIDKEVSDSISTERKRLFKENPDLVPPKRKVIATYIITGVKKIPFIGDLIRGGEKVFEAVDEIKKDIKYWYKCEGGKELVGIVLSVAGAILAAVVCVCAFTFSGGTIFVFIATVAGAISAGIGVFNAATNIVTSFQAYDAARDGHPGMAQIYAQQDTVSDVLKQTNYHNKTLNRLSNKAAMVIEVTDAVCSTISGVIDIGKSIKEFWKTDLLGFLKKHDFKGFRSELWSGIKSIKTNFKVSDLISGDLNFKQWKSLFDMDLKTYMKTLGKIAKAGKSIIADIDKINEGDMKWSELLAKRLIIGIDSTVFNRQDIGFGINADGIKYDYNQMTYNELVNFNGTLGTLFIKYDKSDLTNFINIVRTPIENIGMLKLLNDHFGNNTFDNIFDFKGGIIKNFKTIFDSDKWTGHFTPPDIPEISVPQIDSIISALGKISSGGMTDMENLNIMEKINSVIGRSAVRPTGTESSSNVVGSITEALRQVRDLLDKKVLPAGVHMSELDSMITDLEDLRQKLASQPNVSNVPPMFAYMNPGKTFIMTNIVFAFDIRVAHPYVNVAI